MTEKQLNGIRAEVTLELLKSLASKVISTKERIMFLNAQYEAISKKKDKELTTSERKLKEEHEANIAAFTDGLRDAEIHEKNFITLIQSYEENKPLTF